MKLTFAERKFLRTHRKATVVDNGREVTMHGAMRRRCMLVCKDGRAYVRCAHTNKLLCDLSEDGYNLLKSEGYFEE